MKLRRRLLWLVVGMVLVGAGSSYASLIPGVTASTNMLWTNSTSVTNIVNGSGLSGNVPSLSGVHTYPNAGNVWASGYKYGNVTFDLHGEYFVESMSVWQFNGDNTIGMRDVGWLASTDGINFAPVSGAPTLFAQGPWVSPVGVQVFDFPAVQATHLRMNVLNNYGHASSSGLAEIQFDGSPVPEPATLAMVGLGGVAFLRRRREGRRLA